MYGTGGVYTRNGMRVSFGVAVSLLLETDAQEDARPNSSCYS